MKRAAVNSVGGVSTVCGRRHAVCERACYYCTRLHLDSAGSSFNCLIRFLSAKTLCGPPTGTRSGPARNQTFSSALCLKTRTGEGQSASHGSLTHPDHNEQAWCEGEGAQLLLRSGGEQLHFVSVKVLSENPFKEEVRCCPAANLKSPEGNSNLEEKRESFASAVHFYSVD